jgi:DNA-binding NarL/FixJ family response regulator
MPALSAEVLGSTRSVGRRHPTDEELNVTLDVVVVDDPALMRAEFTMILNGQPEFEVLGEAENGRDAVDFCRQARPDLVMMDIRMPEMDVIEATRLITEDDGYDTKVLVLTTFDLDEYVYAAVRAGASGYLLKDTPPQKLLAALRIIADGNALLSPSVIKRLIEEFARQPQNGTCRRRVAGRSDQTPARGTAAPCRRAQQSRDRERPLHR